MDDDKVLRLRQLAAILGKRGYSDLVNEAVDEYLRQHAPRRTRDGFEDPFEGIWTEEEAEAVRERIKESRASWRRS